MSLEKFGLWSREVNNRRMRDEIIRGTMNDDGSHLPVFINRLVSDMAVGRGAPERRDRRTGEESAVSLQMICQRLHHECYS
eukprot:COSAG02_NODE_2033_length_10056_cov_31.055539_6_plen_81_part_00